MDLSTPSAINALRMLAHYFKNTEPSNSVVYTQKANELSARWAEYRKTQSSGE